MFHHPCHPWWMFVSGEEEAVRSLAGLVLRRWTVVTRRRVWRTTRRVSAKSAPLIKNQCCTRKGGRVIQSTTRVGREVLGDVVFKVEGCRETTVPKAGDSGSGLVAARASRSVPARQASKPLADHVQGFHIRASVGHDPVKEHPCACGLPNCMCSITSMFGTMYIRCTISCSYINLT